MLNLCGVQISWRSQYTKVAEIMERSRLSLMPTLSLLGILAHPDDEQVMSGAFAQAAAEGLRTGLICATRGEEGQIHPSVDATRDTLAQVREGELRRAAAVIGIKGLWFLDYRDSGMMGTAENDNAVNFHMADEQEALVKIVKIVRSFKPTVIVTFDPTGGYGHPDHLKVHKLATLAFIAAADPEQFTETGEPWQTARLYYAAFPRSSMRRMRGFLEEHDPDSDFLKIDMEQFGLADKDITNIIDVRKWSAIKERSLRQHQTQRADYERWSSLPEQVLGEMRASEYFSLAAGVPLPPTPGAKKDLFAGLRRQSA